VNARRALARLRWQGVAGLALLACGAALALAVIPARQARHAELRAELEALHARPRAGAPAALPAGEARLLKFYAYFPPLATLPDWLERIYAAGARHGLALEAGEYRLVPEPGARLARYQLTLPVRGGYGPIRAFIAEVLREVPASALEEVGFRRDAIGSATLQARLRFALYLERP